MILNKNKIGLTSSVFLGVSAIIGSGWLFAPFKTAEIAGPAAVFSWIVGAILVLLLSFCFAEIAALYPKRGLSAIIPTLSHNKFFGFPFALANWLGVVGVIGLEADASVQYLIHLFPALVYYFFFNGELTVLGNCISITLVILFSLANYWGAKVLAKTNNILTVIKLIVPVMTALIVIAVAFSPENFVIQSDTLVPYGFRSIFLALVSSGIIVAFNGFQTVVSFASEIKQPHKVIPKALAWSIVICLAVYLLLQVAFIGALPSILVQNGWSQLSMSAPMVQLSLMLGLGMLTSIIYFGAVLAPSGAALAFTGTATRMFTAMARRGQMPRFFDAVHSVYKVSRRSLLVNTMIALLFVLLFRSWNRLAAVISMLHIVSYLPIPLALVVFRAQKPAKKYLFRVFAGKAIALFLFVVFTYLLTLIDPTLVAEFITFFVCSLAVYILMVERTVHDMLSACKSAGSLLVYFMGLLLLVEVLPDYLSDGWLYNLVFLIFALFSFWLMTKQPRSVANT